MSALLIDIHIADKSAKNTCHDKLDMNKFDKYDTNMFKKLKWTNIHIEQYDRHHKIEKIYIHVNVPNLELIIEPNKTVIENSTIRIYYDYPLHNNAMLTFVRDGGFTAHQLVSAICHGYKEIYKIEDSHDIPQMIPGMLNRAESHGPFGIWGHVISDLIVHTIKYNKEHNIVIFSCDS